MKIDSPLLSICIPTYNRAQYLKRAIESVVSQKEFINSNDVELVICDNNSSDETEDVVRKFIEEFGGKKIVYIRNNEFLHSSENFHKVLNSGAGKLLKLSNDTLFYDEGGLEFLLNHIRKYVNEKRVIFINPSSNNIEGALECNTADEFVKAISYSITWIGGFCVWRDDLKYIEKFVTEKDSRLAQVDVILEMLRDKKSAVVVQFTKFHSDPPKKKGKVDGYNIAEVFGYNYLNILKKYLGDGVLSQEVFRKEKRIILKKLINKFYFDYKKQYSFQKTGYFKWLWNDYKLCPYFYADLISWLFKSLAYKVRFLFWIEKSKDEEFKYKTFTIFGMKFKSKKRRRSV